MLCVLGGEERFVRERGRSVGAVRCFVIFFFQAKQGKRVAAESRGLGYVYRGRRRELVCVGGGVTFICVKPREGESSARLTNLPSVTGPIV